MPAQWTADVIGKMHLYKITSVKLAEKIGWNPKYLSAVLNGKREPKNAEDVVKTAIQKIINEERG
ncbi:hypothetical protein [Negativibacillus massiliensis]|uniref:hypothetical protein n=1 Tax=Negativibacillus massiliensis TaxID=1871035 RepID=UPI003AF2BCF3